MKDGIRPRFVGKVVYVGYTNYEDQIVSGKRIYLKAGEGVVNDKHSGAMRNLDSRETSLLKIGFPKEYPKMVNLRQVTIMSAQDWNKILGNVEMGCHESDLRRDTTTPLFYGSSGENLVFLPDPGYESHDMSFTEQFERPGYKIVFKCEKGRLRSTCLYTTGVNMPCVAPNINIQKIINRWGNISTRGQINFPEHAQGLRGLTAMVLMDGQIRDDWRVEIY